VCASFFELDTLGFYFLLLGMKFRRHHNNKGLAQIKNGKPEKQMRLLAKKMRVAYGKR